MCVIKVVGVRYQSTYVLSKWLVCVMVPMAMLCCVVLCCIVLCCGVVEGCIPSVVFTLQQTMTVLCCLMDNTVLLYSCCFLYPHSHDFKLCCVMVLCSFVLIMLYGIHIVQQTILCCAVLCIVLCNGVV